MTPGMLMAAMRLNIPAIFVSGGPMEADKVQIGDEVIAIDLTDAMIQEAYPSVNQGQIDAIEESACPTYGSCSDMFTAYSTNCIAEALGMALPGNGSLLATHKGRQSLFEQSGIAS